MVYNSRILLKEAKSKLALHLVYWRLDDEEDTTCPSEFKDFDVSHIGVCDELIYIVGHKWLGQKTS